MATPIERFAFDPPEGWGDATIFPTYEANETQVRADLQRLHDQTRDYLNDQLLQSVDDAIEDMEEYVQEAIAGIVVGTLPDRSVDEDKLNVPDGSNGQVLTKDSSAAGGMKWANANVLIKRTATLLSNGWTLGDDDRYYQTVSVAGVTASTEIVLVDCDLTTDDTDARVEILAAWAAGPAANGVTQGSGTLTFYSYEQPTVAIPIFVGVSN